jgi:hypothetical protein
MLQRLVLFTLAPLVSFSSPVFAQRDTPCRDRVPETDTAVPPAHVHFEVTLPGEAMQRFSMTFEGDPKLRGRSAGERWETVRPILERDGGLQVERDLWIR